MRLAAIVVSLLVLVTVAAAGAKADIGIRSVSPNVASPGERVRLDIVAGYLGPKPWRPMPVVMLPQSAAPKPYPCRGGFCTPALYPRQFRQSPYRLLGQVSKWRLSNPRNEGGDATFLFTVPKLQPGRYVFGLFCATCTVGPRGSIVINARLTLTVRG